MKKKVRESLEELLRQWIYDETHNLPFYIGNKTVKGFADAVQVVYEAMAETSKLEDEND